MSLSFIFWKKWIRTEQSAEKAFFSSSYPVGLHLNVSFIFYFRAKKKPADSIFIIAPLGRSCIARVLILLLRQFRIFFTIGSLNCHGFWLKLSLLIFRVSLSVWLASPCEWYELFLTRFDAEKGESNRFSTHWKRTTFLLIQRFYVHWSKKIERKQDNSDWSKK